MKTNIETKSALSLIGAFALAAELTLALGTSASQSHPTASCEPGSLIQRAGCFDVPREPTWYPYGGGVGRPMIAYSVRF